MFRSLILITFCTFLLASCGSDESSFGVKPFNGKIKNSVRKSTPEFLQDPKAKQGAPNIIVILADDLGYADTSPYGSEIETPNLEKLADQGLTYNNFTVTAMCSPTRAALLTGLNHHSTGVGWVGEWDFGYPGYRGEIQDNVLTLPQILQQEGYATFAAGKWHLTTGEHRSAVGPFNSWPTHKGFDRYWGFLEGETDQFEPAYLIKGNEIVETPKTGAEYGKPDEHYYFPDALTHNAIQMIKDLRTIDMNKPFFMYYTPGAVHAPLQTLKADREKYIGKYAEGWDAIRAQRLAKQKELGIAPTNTQLTEHNPSVVAWDTLTPDQQNMYARHQENYAGFVDNLDQQVGALVSYLEETGQRENTIIVFLSDNGASPEGDVEGQANSLAYFHYHNTTTEENLKFFDDLGGPNTHPHYPWGWLQASNTPHKHTKRTTHGGGIRTPFIFSWPKGIQAAGELRTQFHHITDLAPTLLELLNIDVSKHYQGKPVKPIEGMSFAYTLEDKEIPSQKLEQYYEIEANRAYYDKTDGTAWKISSVRQVTQNSSQKYTDTKWELYNLDEDFSEANNLAEQHPEIVERLKDKWWQAAETYNVLPLVDTGLLERALYSKFVKQPPPDFRRIPVGGKPIPHNLAPILPGKSYVITAEIERDSTTQSGVLAAQGDRFSGYSIYIQDNKLVYERNVGFDVIRLISNDEVPTGKATIEVKYDKVSTGLAVVKGLFSDGLEFNRLSVLKGTLTLMIDGKETGSVEVEQPFMIGWEGLDIGRDSGSAVSTHYQAPFTFEGQLSHVDYQLH